MLGLAYKPFSSAVEESQGLALARALSQRGMRVIAFDPLAGDAARAGVCDHVLVLDSLEDCLAQANVVLVTTPVPAFRSLSAEAFQRENGRVTIVDFWRVLERSPRGAGTVRYVRAGRGRDDAENEVLLRGLWQAGGPGPGAAQEAGTQPGGDPVLERAVRDGHR